MKNVVFISAGNYDTSKCSSSLEKKWKTISDKFNVYIVARGNTWKSNKYGCSFYLTPKFFGKLWFIPWTVISFFRALLIIREKKIDIVVCQSPVFEGLIGVLLKLFTQKELIIEVHGDWIESPFYYFDIPAKKIIKYFLVLAGEISLKYTDKVRVISEATRKLVGKYGECNHIYKFHTFTDLDVFDDVCDITYSKTIVYAGWLYPLKGVQFLIEAFAAIQDRHKEFRLVIAGDGPFKGDLIALSKEKSLVNVEFTGWLTPSELKMVLSSSFCVVLPSLSEGLGRILIEAAMLQKACIGSNIDGIPDVIQDGETGYLFRPGDFGDLSDKLERLMSDSSMAIAMGEKGRKIIEQRYSNKVYFDSYIHMLTDPIQSRHS